MKCSVDWCSRPRAGLGLCQSHWRQQREGRPLGVFKTYGTPAERLATKWTPEPNTGCWLWIARVTKTGYGEIYWPEAKRPVLAHRASWMIHVGPIPAGFHVLHRCNNGGLGCINPAHLYIGTHQDNMRDLVRAGNTTRVHAQASLEAMRAVAATGIFTQRELARWWGISASFASAVIKRKVRNEIRA